MKKDTIKLKMLGITDEIDQLNAEAMTEEKFWGALALDEGNTFDYGRDVLTEDRYYET